MLQIRSNGIYYFRWVYPLYLQGILGKRELIKSLNTRSKSTALARASGYFLMVDRLKQLKDSFIAGEISQREYHDLGYEEVTGDIFAALVNDFDEVFQPKTIAEVQRYRKSLEGMLRKIQESSTNEAGEYECGKTLREYFKNWIKREKNLAVFHDFYVMFSPDHNLQKRLIDDFIGISHLLCVKMDEKLNKVNPKPGVPGFVQKMLEGGEYTQIEGPAHDVKAVYFETLAYEFTNFKIGEGLSDQMQKEYARNIPLIQTLLPDKPISEITSNDIKVCLDKCRLIPKRSKKPYKDMQIDELVILDVPVEDRVSAKTVLEIKKLIQGLFKFAVSKEYVDLSPAVNVDFKYEREYTRGSYYDSEVLKILDHVSLTQSESIQWIIHLGAYTGARLGEIVQLRSEDIKKSDSGDVWYILVTPEAGSLKTKNSFRTIPIHDLIVKRGFLEYVSKRNGKLFSDVPNGKSITRKFNKIRDDAGVSKNNEFNQSRTFHSFRHSFVTKAREAQVSDALIQEVVGHEKTSAGITDSYTQRFSVAKLKQVVDAINYQEG